MDLQPNEQPHVRLEHVMYGLAHKDLIDRRWRADDGPKRLNELANIQVESGGVYLPSAVGLELISGLMVE